MSVYQSAPTLEQAAITAKDFNFWYGDFHALTGLDLNIAKNAITSFIGPSGCGKSTFLRCINRMNDLIEGTRVEGTMTLDGNDIYAEGVDPVDLRRRVGMIFQQPNPFPKSIYENVAFGPRLQGVTSKSDLDDIVEESLKRANLWKEVSNQLNKDGLALSGGQQQRLRFAGRVQAVGLEQLRVGDDRGEQKRREVFPLPRPRDRLAFALSLHQLVLLGPGCLRVILLACELRTLYLNAQIFEVHLP